MMLENNIGLKKIRQVALPCTDIKRSKSFYQSTLGADFIAEFDPPGIIFFRFGGIRLMLERTESARAKGAVLYFEVDDITRSYKVLKDNGVSFDSEPHLIYRDEDGVFGKSGEEEWMAFFRDPDGNTLALVSRFVN